MAIEAQLADGRILEFPDGTDPSVVQATVKRIVAQSAPPKESTIGGELVRGGKQVLSSARTGLESILSPEEAAKAGVARSEAISKEAGEGPSLEAVQKAYQDKGLLSAAGEAISQIPRALAGQGANLASMYAAGKAGAAAGAPFGVRGRIVGGVAGTAGALLPQFMGANVERQASEQMEEGKDVNINRTKAYTAAAGQAALEGAGTAFTLGKRVVKGVLGIADDAALATAKTQAELVKAAERSLAASAGRGVVRGAAEIPVEVSQQILERYQAGLDLTSPEALKEYGESAYQAALIGGPLGAAGNVMERSGAKAEIEQQKAAEAYRNAPPAPETQEGTEPAQGEVTPKPPLDLTQAQYTDLVAAREELKQQPQTDEVRAQIKDLDAQILSYHEQEVGRIRAEKQLEDEARDKFPGLAAEPAQQSLFPELEIVRPEAEEARKPAPKTARDVLNRRTVDEDLARMDADKAQQELERLGGQQRLPLRRISEGKDVDRGLPIPARPDEITMKDLEDLGIPMRTSQKWLEQNVIGKTPAEIQVLVGNNPDLLLGKGARAQILKYLTAPVPEGFKEEPRVTPTTQTNQPKRGPVTRGGKPSVAVSGQPASTDVVQPGAGVSTTPGTPATPDGLGLAPAGQPAGKGATAKGAAKPALTPPAVRTADQVMDEMRALREEQQALLTKSGNRPAVNSKARARWDEITDLLNQKMSEWNALDRAERTAKGTNAPKPATPTVAAKPATTPAAPKETKAPAPAVATETVEAETAEEEAARKAEAEDVKHRLEEVERKLKERPAPKAAAPEPKAEKPATKELPEKLREPVGTSDFGMEEGEKEVLRGPQGMLFPMSKREELEYIARKEEENAKKEEVEDAPEADTRQMDLVFPADEQEIAAAIDGKNVLEAATWAANNLPDPDQKMIAQRVAATLRELQAVGVIMGPIKITAPGRRLVSGANAVAVMAPGKNNTPSTVRITFNHPSNGVYSGTDPESVLHELIHAATMAAIQIGNKKSAVNTRVGKTVGDLYDVANAVFQHVDDKHARGEPLNDIEKKLRTRYMRDVDEILAWTLTNRDMQAYMETIPYKNLSLWTKFVQSVRNLLGLTAKADTALSEILRVGGELTELTNADLKDATAATGRQFKVAYGTESLVDSMGPLDANQTTGLKKLIAGVRASPDIDYVTKFRTQTADIGATIEQRLRSKFDGAVRNSLGELNPMGLYRQAQDYSKMLLEYFQTGTLYKEPATGLWKSGVGKGVRPPAEVYELLDKYAEKNGYTRERATQIASRILEGVRLDAMRTANKTQGAGFLLHLKDPQIDQLLAEYNADPDLKELSKLMDEARIAMVDNMVKVGRLTAEQGKEWKEVVGYVPFDRIEDFATRYNAAKKISTKGLAQLGKLPELIGSEVRPVGNVFDNYINTLGWMVGQTLKTDATLQTLRSLEDLGFAKFLGRSPQGKPNAVGAYVDGEMMYYNLPSKYDLMAFKDLNPPKAGWLRAMGAFSNVLRKTVTVLPPFALKQVTDDVQRAILTSGVRNPGALIWMSLTNFPKLAYAELRGIQHPDVKEFGRLGLTGEYDFEAGKPASSLLKDLGYKKRGRFEELLHRLDGITRASDLAVRKAIYDQTMKESQGDELLAQTRAREFINFRRRGGSDFVGAMVTTIPFFNAYIQGMDVLYRAASGKDSSSSVDRAQARQLFWSRAATVMMLSSLYALGKDDEDKDYQEMDLRTRDSNWILPGGYKIPVPGELGAIFKVIPERVVEYMKRQGTPEEQTAWEATRTTLSYMYEQYLGRAVPVPQAIKPVMEAWANKSFLTGRDLEGFHHKAMDPSARVTEQTSELAKAIAAFSRDQIGVEVSPIMIDNALRGYFGSSAAMATMVTDSLLNPTRIDRPLHKYALLSNYLYDPVGTRRMTEFYEEREKVGKANTTLRELMKTDMARAEKYAEEHSDELMLEGMVNSTLEQLERTRAYRKYLNSVDGANDMRKEDREAELKEIKQMEIEYVKWVREAQTELRKAQR